MKLSKKATMFFGANRRVVTASAPGRIDVMGGIGDYSGSLVLQTPIRERTRVAVALRGDGVFRAHSRSAKAAGRHHTAEFQLNQFNARGIKAFVANARQVLNEHSDTSWSAYLLGCALILNHEANANIQGADFWVETDVPIGKGISSSAALEVATMTALCKAAKINLSGNQLPILAQRVENGIVGAPCGLMDQLACTFGRENKLLPILCQPDVLGGPISLPKPFRLMGVDSGVRHAVSGSSYGDVRTAAFMGYSIIAAHLGATQAQLKRARRAALPFNGYVANIKPSQFENEFESLLPKTMTGKAFLQKYGETIDPYTTPVSSRAYSILPCVRYPIYENQRVKTFQTLLQYLNTGLVTNKARSDCAMQLGELMFQSHQGYNRCKLGSAATDALVERGIEFGPENGIYGAKITGGGSGGVVCFLCEGRKGAQSVRQIAALHAKDFNSEAAIFSGSSDGAHWVKPISIST